MKFDRPDAGGVEVAELLANLAFDLESADSPSRPGLSWKNGLCGAVLARTLDATTPAEVVPPTRIASGPEMTAGAPSRGSGRSLAVKCFHSGMSPVVVGTAQ